jgi:hypothetical protein
MEQLIVNAANKAVQILIVIFFKESPHMDSDKRGLLRYGWTYENKHRLAAMMWQLYGIKMGA